MAGGDASQMPAGLDPNWINRKFEAIEQWQREMMPSVAQSVTGIVSTIADKVTVTTAQRTISVAGGVTAGMSNAFTAVTMTAPSWATRGYVLPPLSRFVSATASLATDVHGHVSLLDPSYAGPVTGQQLYFSFAYNVTDWLYIQQAINPALITVAAGSISLNGRIDIVRDSTITGGITVEFSVPVIWIP